MPSFDPEKLRHETDAVLAAIVMSSDDAIVSKTLDGIVRTWNEGAARIFGYTAEEMIGRPIATLFPADRLDEEPQILSRVMRGERVDHFETVRVRKDGRHIEVSVSISPIRDATGEIVGASKIARDITSQKMYERELTAARALAESANRMKDRFLAAVSHELRTPLTPVLAAVSSLETDTGLDESVRQILTIIRQNVETETRLIDDLLDITRLARGDLKLHLQPLDIANLLAGIVDSRSIDAARKGVVLATQLDATRTQVSADANRLRQVIDHVIGNAIKFTPEGGRVDLRTCDTATGLRIEIADTGIGIDQSLLPRLFELFEQGEAEGVSPTGLGTGLSLAKPIIAMHKGVIFATSGGANGGATFTIDLPVIRENTATANPGSRSSRAEQLGRLLVVEDHPDTLFVMARLLTGAGFKVTTASTVKEALRLAESQDFDLLLSDIGLPDGSGIDLMQHLKPKGVRGIALSGYGLDTDIARSRQAGFEHHLTKPIDFQNLTQSIMKILPKSA